jgi:hypothetical protein
MLLLEGHGDIRQLQLKRISLITEDFVLMSTRLACDKE